MKSCCDKCIELDPVYNDKCQAGCYQKVFSNDYFWAWNCFDRKFEKRPEVDLVINFFLYKSINVYWPNGLVPTQYTDFDFYSSTSGNYTNWFGSEILFHIVFIDQWKNSNWKSFSSNFIGQSDSSVASFCVWLIFVRKLWCRHRRFRRLGVSFQDQPCS